MQCYPQEQANGLVQRQQWGAPRPRPVTHAILSSHWLRNAQDNMQQKKGRQVDPGGLLNKVLYGEAPPRGPNPYLLYTIFDRKGTPFVYLPLKNGTPFTYPLKNTASLF